MFTPHKKPSRVDQWDGPKRSSRSEEPLLTQLNRRGVMLRLACVLATALGATLLAFFWGTPQPHRVGEITPREVRARAAFDVVDQVKTDLKRSAAVDEIDLEKRTEERCDAVREAVAPIVDHYAQGS